MPATAASALSSAIARNTRPHVVRERNRPTRTIVAAAVRIAITCASEQPHGAEDAASQRRNLTEMSSRRKYVASAGPK